MNSIEAYKRFQLKLNSLANSDNVDISEGEFVLIYNEQQVNWYEDNFKNVSSKFKTSDVQKLVERDLNLTLIREHEDYVNFKLPENYLDYISSYSKCTKGNCSDRRIRNYQIQLPNRELFYRDNFNNPSFEYSETFITVSSDGLQVYKTDFDVNKVYLTYYRYPINIDIEGYIKIDQTPSTTINPELTDDFVNEIIDRCVADVQRSFENTGGYQLAQDRVNRD